MSKTRYVPFRRTVTDVVSAYRSGAFARLAPEARIAIWCDWFSPKPMLPALADQGIEALGQVLDLGIPGLGDLNVLFKQQYGETCLNSILLFAGDDGPTLYQIAFSALSDQDDWAEVENGCTVSVSDGRNWTRLLEEGSWEQALDALRSHALATA